ncbi:MAG: Sorbitol dehydrogenase [Planctomycetes bacterium]|nr:Sorbitol dehydrogenase [Planctomycetota bacterium]
MRAAVYRGKGDVRVEDVPVPEIAAGELLVRIDCCGVCWTDLKKVDYGTVPPPRIFGHEMAGVVAAAGAGVRGFAEGDRVQVYHHIPCRTCALCERKLYAQCPVYKRTGSGAGFEPSGGGFADYIRVMPWIVEGGGVTPVPRGASLEAASFLEPVNTCLKCVRFAAVRPGDTALVVGAGAIGLVLARLLLLEGAVVVVSEPLADRRERALASGCAAAFDPRADDVAARVRDMTRGAGADAALVAVPGQAPVDTAMAAIRPGGRTVLFAHTKLDDPVTVDGGQVCFLEKQLVGSYSADADLNEETADLVFSGRLRVDDLVTDRLPIERATEAFELARKPRPGSLKVLVTCRDGAGV